MSKALIITEKPSVARDIVEALGGFTEKFKGEYYESDDYICTYAVGHILTFFAPEDISSDYKRWRLQDLPIIPESFQTKPMEKQKGRLKAIKRVLGRKDVDRVINACDAAREGELIFREIMEHLGNKKPILRLWLQSMTKASIIKGFRELGDGSAYEGLAAAALCRAKADWLIGMNATRALTVRLKSRNQRGVSWSAGRVQTPTLSLLVDRELKVLEHQPIPFWRVKGFFQAEGHVYESFWFDPHFKKVDDDRDKKEDRIFNKEQVETILLAVQNGRPAVASETRKPSPKKPPLPFDLTALQRMCNSRFGWSASRTTKAAQRCYETHKVLTYPRTSSRALPENYREEVDRVLEVLKGTKSFAPYASHLIKSGRQNEKLIFDDSKVTDHFAIMPTGEQKKLEGDDAKIYDLVVRQFLAAFYPASIYEDVERITEVEGQFFKSKPPKVLKEAGWEVVFGKKPSDKDGFPPLKPGEDKVSGVAVKTDKAESEELETKPPSRISEAGLLGMMENAGGQVDEDHLATALKAAEGLGTAATRADIIENLKTREYVDDGLRPTVKGIRLVDILHRIGASRLTSAKLTAELELHLSEVERKERDAKAFIREIEEYAKEVVDKTRDFDFETIYPEKDPLGSCPICKRLVYERAWFYGCEGTSRAANVKKCNFIIWKDNNGRYINRSVVKTLLEDGVTRELSGFRTLNGQVYKAVLALENGLLVRQSIKNDGENIGEGFDVNEEPLGSCPIHKKCRVIETPYEFICETKKKAKEDGDSQTLGLSLPRMLCKREMRREEAESFLEKGETDTLSGFISRKGRKFSAKLVFDEKTGGFSFEFPNWGGKKAKKEEDEAAEKKQEAAVESEA